MTSHIAQLTYAIGDIHGYDDLFERLIDRIRVDAEWVRQRPRIVLLGDYIDRGPASPQVLERILRLEQAAWCDLIALKGNHEAALLRFLDEPTFGETWREWGGAATLQAYGVDMPYLCNAADVWNEVRDAASKSIDTRHIDLLKRLPPIYQADDYVFVHAGVDPERPLVEQDAETFMYIRGRFLRSEKACDYVVVWPHTRRHPHRCTLAYRRRYRRLL